MSNIQTGAERMPHDLSPSWLPCWSDWSSYYHFNYSGYRWRLLRDGRRWRSPSFSIASWPCYRSEERFSRNAETDLVCRLLLEKKKNTDKCDWQPRTASYP